MHPSFPYHLLRLKNHLFILSGNFTSQGLDQIGISNQRGRGGNPPPSLLWDDGSYPTCIRQIPYFSILQIYSTNVNCSFDAFKHCLTRRLLLMNLTFKDCLCSISGALILTSSTCSLKSRWISRLVLPYFWLYLGVKMSNRFDQYCFQELGKAYCKNSWQFGEAHPATFATMVWSLPVVIWISVPGTCSSFRHHGLITSCCDLDLGARWDFSNLPTTNPYVLISVMINFFQRQNPLVVCIDQGSNTLSLINIKLVLGCFYIQVYSWVRIHYLVNKLSIPHAPIFYLSSITA